jgi:hypothetical protein
LTSGIAIEVNRERFARTTICGYGCPDLEVALPSGRREKGFACEPGDWSRRSGCMRFRPLGRIIRERNSCGVKTSPIPRVRRVACEQRRPSVRARIAARTGARSTTAWRTSTSVTMKACPPGRSTRPISAAAWAMS